MFYRLYVYKEKKLLMKRIEQLEKEKYDKYIEKSKKYMNTYQSSR